jgi:hypothetical protein
MKTSSAFEETEDEYEDEDDEGKDCKKESRPALLVGMAGLLC